MGIKKSLKALESHAKEEWRIHAELMESREKSIRQLAKKHWKDIKKIHKMFFRQLQDAIKLKGKKQKNTDEQNKDS